MESLIPGATGAGGGSLLGFIAGWFSSRSEMKRNDADHAGMKKEITALSERVVYEDTCKKCSSGNEAQFRNIMERQKETHEMVVKIYDRLK